MRTTSFMAVPHRGHDMLCFVPERSDTGRPLQSSSGLVICQRVATDLVRAAVEKALGVRHCGWRPVIGRGAVAADRPSRHKRADKSFRAPKFHYNTFSPRYGSALRSGKSHHGLHGGGCHERSPERSTTVLLLDRLGYRHCHRGRDTGHLSRSASRGAPQAPPGAS